MPKRRVTSHDVAKRAGVSRTTVSFVLNDVKEARISKKTIQRVLAAAKELGYVPNATAQALARRRTEIIGVVFSKSYHRQIVSNASLSLFIDGLMDIVRQYGLRLLLDIVEEQGETDAYMNLAQAKRIDGLILLNPRSDDAELRALVEDDLPVVLIGHLPEVALCSVDVDNRASVRRGVQHLLELGHRRIGFITNAPLSYTVASERLKGYQDALEGAGLAYDEALVEHAAFSPDSGFHALNRLLDRVGRLPALYIASDEVAFGALAALRRRGLRVPDDLALVGFDDVPLSRYVDPPLTTIRVPVDDLGRKAGELMSSLIFDRARPGRKVLLDTELVVRESSAPPGRTRK